MRVSGKVVSEKMIDVKITCNYSYLFINLFLYYDLLVYIVSLKVTALSFNTVGLFMSSAFNVVACFMLALCSNNKFLILESVLQVVA